MAEFHGGPAAGARVAVPEVAAFLLVALGREIHGYVQRQDGNFRHHGLLAISGARAADVLRKHGERFVELKEEGGQV